MAGLLGYNQGKKKSPSQNGLLSMDALQEIRDEKLTPVEQLADTEFRAQLNPQGIARYSDVYRKPSKHTGLAYYNAPTGLEGFYTGPEASTSESLWDDPEESKHVVPGQVFWPRTSYQVTTELDQATPPYHWAKENPEDTLNHEAVHEALETAVYSEFMSGPSKDIYVELDSPEAKNAGIRISEALTRHHDTMYPKSEYQRLAARNFFSQELERARHFSREYPSWHENLRSRSMETWQYYHYPTSEQRRLWQKYEDLIQSEIDYMYGDREPKALKLAEIYNSIEAAAKKRYEALGYK